jgi:hypothetical protein
MILEKRYVVIKIKDIEKYVPGYKWKLMQEMICEDIEKKRALEGKPPVECICIERDWPEYEPVLKMLSDRVDKDGYAPRYPWHPSECDLIPAKVIWKQYKRKGLSEMRPYINGEDLTGVSVSDPDHPETDMGMIARNPKDHADQWYVARKYFEDNLEEVTAQKEGV